MIAGIMMIDHAEVVHQKSLTITTTNSAVDTQDMTKVIDTLLEFSKHAMIMHVGLK